MRSCKHLYLKMQNMLSKVKRFLILILYYEISKLCVPLSVREHPSTVCFLCGLQKARPNLFKVQSQILRGDTYRLPIKFNNLSNDAFSPALLLQLAENPSHALQITTHKQYVCSCVRPSKHVSMQIIFYLCPIENTLLCETQGRITSLSCPRLI